jgi:hypothetical protein
MMDKPALQALRTLVEKAETGDEIEEPLRLYVMSDDLRRKKWFQIQEEWFREYPRHEDAERVVGYKEYWRRQKAAVLAFLDIDLVLIKEPTPEA